MRYARLKQLYRYQYPDWNLIGNAGDCIQNIAVEEIYKELGIDVNSLVQINRDEIPSYSGEKVVLPMQGWFGNIYNIFPVDWSENIIPVFIGYHLNPANNGRNIFIKNGLAKKIKTYEPVGCRDNSTRKFLRNAGVDTYFSGCLTLTFSRREIEPQNGKIFLVDLTEKSKAIIPDKIKNAADTSITHSYHFKDYPISEQEGIEFENYSRTILKRYKEEAKLVITSRIHCAMPCAAMGIPVIFINEDTGNSRFDVLDGIIPCYSPKSKINWHPKPVNIEKIKSAIKENAVMRITIAAQRSGLQIGKIYSIADIKRIEYTLFINSFRIAWRFRFLRNLMFFYKFCTFYFNQ